MAACTYVQVHVRSDWTPGRTAARGLGGSALVFVSLSIATSERRGHLYAAGVRPVFDTLAGCLRMSEVGVHLRHTLITTERSCCAVRPDRWNAVAELLMYAQPLLT